MWRSEVALYGYQFWRNIRFFFKYLEFQMFSKDVHNFFLGYLMNSGCAFVHIFSETAL